MDILESTIDTLSETHLSSLRQYVQTGGKGTKEVQLLDLLTRSPRPSSKSIHASLYKPANANAYHSLRKRLSAKVMEFVALLQLSQDEEGASSIAGLMVQADFFLSNRQYSTAARLLEKAKSKALRREQYDLLESLLIREINHATGLGLNPELLLKEWEENKEKKELHQRLAFSNSLIQFKLKQARAKGSVLDHELLSAEILNSLNISSQAVASPRFMFALVQSLRSGVVSSKDYSRFAPYVLSVYENLRTRHAFDKEHRTEEIGFLYMLAHVHYRNRNFEKSEGYLAQMRAFYEQHTIRAFYHKYIPLCAAVAGFSGRNEEAVNVLEEALKKRSIREIEDRLTMQLNLAVYYFQSKSYKKANKTLLSMHHSDAWLEKKMGMEWRFKKEMIELIVQVELGNSEIALARVKRLERGFSEFLQHPIYQRASLFIRFIKEMILRPERATTEAFAKEVDAANMGLPQHQEDIQAITFFCWLKAKMLNKDYYEVLLEAMNNNETKN